MAELSGPSNLPTTGGLESEGTIKSGARARQLVFLPALPLLLLVLLTITAPLLPIADPFDQDLTQRLVPPVWQEGGAWSHPLGTDALGRDMLSRLTYGARLSLFIGAAAVAVSATFGTLLGLIAGYHGGWVDFVISRLTDAQLSIPFLLLTMAIIMAQGKSVPTIVAALAIVGWARYARIMRSETIAMRGRPFVLGLRVIGASWPTILFRHILPNVGGTLLVIATLEVGAMILTESALSFLGLGVVPPDMSWGAMLAEGRLHMNTAWWLVAFPGIAITGVVVLASFLGDAVQTRYDPLARRW